MSPDGEPINNNVDEPQGKVNTPEITSSNQNILDTNQKPEGLIEQRIPIVNAESQLSIDIIDQRWKLITEVIRRDLLVKPEVRQRLIQFSNQGVSEKLPEELIKSLVDEDERVAALFTRYQQDLGQFLSLPVVPEDQIKPDLKHATRLVDVEKAMADFSELYGKDSPAYIQRMQEYVNSGRFTYGITDEERTLATKRYAYSRDVKLLALSAEMVESGTDINLNNNGEVLLPSGTKIVIDPKIPQTTRTDLLSPQLWEKRRQLKDRVYEIYVNDRKYLLKEKKTDRHTDTKQGGHVDGQLSSEEFEIAQNFQDNAQITQGDIKTGWEKPVGFVTFPDGFQFVVFEFEENLISEEDLRGKLQVEIFNHQPQYQEEYNRVLQSNERKGILNTIATKLKLRKETPLTYQQFAILKANRIKKRAENLLKKTIIQMGYDNSDQDGFSFRINSDPNQFQLEIMGFDFEYYSKIPDEEVQQKLARYNEFIEADLTKFDRRIPFFRWPDHSPVTKEHQQAYDKMLAEEMAELATN